MSKRNSQEAKRNARERLRTERERQAKKEKIRRQLIVVASVAGVVAVAGGIGIALSNMGSGGDGTDWDEVASQLAESEEAGDDTSYRVPEHSSGEDGLTIRVGDENAENAFTFYEEPRCGHCAEFEREIGDTVREGIANGEYTVDFMFGTFFDDQMNGGTASRNAVSALGAALDVSPEAFLGYAEQLYSEEFHSAQDDFESDELLIEIGQSVEELNGNKSFEDAINDSTFAGWALKVSEKFASTEEVEGTPTIMLNGETLPTPGTSDEFLNLYESAKK